jgi:TonB family protein
MPSTSRAPVRRVLPEVPQSASETIQGTVRVTVRVTVNPAGNVAGAAAESPGSSRYFTGLALEAARKWVFDSAPEEAAPEDWLLRFEFQRDAITAEARRAGR